METLSYEGRSRDFPGGPVAKTPCSQCRGRGSIPGQGIRFLMLQLKTPQDPAQPNR